MNRLRWAGYVTRIRRENEEIIKKLMIVKLEGKRKKGKPRTGWMYGVEMDLRNLGVVNLKAKAQELDGWRRFSEQTKIHKGRSQWPRSLRYETSSPA
jgi:hypothetical protein